MKKIEDVIAVLETIPGKEWCVDIRTDDQNRHCVLGHLDQRPEFKLRQTDWGCDNLLRELGLRPTELAEVNNGREHYCGPRKYSTRGSAIKTRVLRYLRKKALEVTGK